LSLYSIYIQCQFLVNFVHFVTTIIWHTVYIIDDLFSAELSDAMMMKTCDCNYRAKTFTTPIPFQFIPFIDLTCSSVCVCVWVCVHGSGLIQLVAIYVSFSYHTLHAAVDTCKTQWICFAFAFRLSSVDLACGQCCQFSYFIATFGCFYWNLENC